MIGRRLTPIVKEALDRQAAGVLIDAHQKGNTPKNEGLIFSQRCGGYDNVE